MKTTPTIAKTPLLHVNCNSKHFAQVKEAAKMANELLGSEEFYSRIAAQPWFELATVSPEVIANLMKTTKIKMTLDLYYAMSSVHNIDGYDDCENPSVIHLNIWKIDRSPASICNTIIHSCVHAVNACNPEYYFGHGDRTVKGKDNTAPYRIGALAQRMASMDEPAYIPLEHDWYDTGTRQYPIAAFLATHSDHSSCFFPIVD